MLDTIDITNAFNNTLQIRIVEKLFKLGTPDYIVQIVCIKTKIDFPVNGEGKVLMRSSISSYEKRSNILHTVISDMNHGISTFIQNPDAITRILLTGQFGSDCSRGEWQLDEDEEKIHTLDVIIYQAKQRLVYRLVHFKPSREIFSFNNTYREKMFHTKIVVLQKAPLVTLTLKRP